MNDLPPRLAVACVLLGCSLFAQEYRHADVPLFAGACFDAVSQRVVGLGLSSYSHEWDGIAWRRAPDRAAPFGWCHAEPATGRLFAFVMDGSTGRFRVEVRVGNEWQSVTTTSGPSGTAGLAFDAARGEVITFGGEDMLGYSSDTWAFDGTAWSLRQPSNAPSPRRFPSMTFDSTRQRVVLFGGQNQPPQLDDTWEWDGVDWSLVATATRPSNIMFSPMVYDSTRQRTVLLGNTVPAGTSPGAGVVEHWEYDGTNWTQLPAPPLGLGGRLVFVAAFDEARGETLVVDSSDAATRRNDVWAWDGLAWTQRPGFGQQPWGRTGGSATADATGTRLLSFGGLNALVPTAGPLDELWGYDGTGWSLLGTGTVPARASAVMWSQGPDTFVFGGADASSAALGDTWRWNGSSWSPVTSPSSPPPREAAAIALDTSANQAVLFGGKAGSLLGDTWTFDGAVWQQATPATQPTARLGHAMAYDPLRDRVVLFGGQNSFGSLAADDTWEWDGITWQQVVTSTAPPGLGSMVYDANLQRIVYATTNLGAEVQLWTYDGIDWAPLPVAGTLSGADAILEFEPVAVAGLNGRFAVVGGYGVRELLANPAGVESYGGACGNPAPALAADSLPVPGNAAFALEVTAAPSVAPVAVLGAAASANLPVLGCTLLVDPAGVTALTMSSASGFARLGLPLPTNPTLIGADFFFQSAALTSFTPLGLAFSAGLRVRIGE